MRLLKRAINIYCECGIKEVYRKTLVSAKIRSLNKISSLLIPLIYGSGSYARKYPLDKTVVLLLSFPRSGSTWIGRMLSHSPDIAYLDEPVTKPILSLSQNRTIIDPHESESLYRHYSRLSDLAFSGVPHQGCENIIHDLKFFSPGWRREKTLLIKEVNPMAAHFFSIQYSPKVVMLIRHPAAVAESIMRLGWFKGNWEEFGYFYGKCMHEAIRACKDNILSILKYEELAMNPEQQFIETFARLHLRPPKDFQDLILRYSQSIRDTNNPFEIERVSYNEVNKWKNKLATDQIRSLQHGYLKAPLEFYRDENCWKLP